MPVKEEVLYWLSEAGADLRHAEASVGLGHYSWACFAAQQVAEKALKALILHVAGEYPRGHDLIYRRVRGFAQLGVSEAALSRLSAYYTVARYPNAGLVRPSEEITREQAEEALETARVVVDEVAKALGDP